MSKEQTAERLAKKIYQKIVEPCNSDEDYLERGVFPLLKNREKFLGHLKKTILKDLEHSEGLIDPDEVLNEILRKSHQDKKTKQWWGTQYDNWHTKRNNETGGKSRNYSEGSENFG